jgi:hypothetical protein
VVLSCNLWDLALYRRYGRTDTHSDANDVTAGQLGAELPASLVEGMWSRDAAAVFQQLKASAVGSAGMSLIGICVGQY